MSLAPKKLSVFEDQPGYDLFQIGKVVEIHLNGVRQHYCVAYDRCAGWLDRYAEDDETGKLKVNGDELVIERMFGVISASVKD